MADIGQETQEILFSFEEKYNPYSFKVEGFPTWLLAREATYNFIKGALSGRRDQIHITLGRDLSHVPRRMYDYIKKRRLINDKVDVVFISNSSFRRGTANSPHDNIFIDNVIDFLPSNLQYVVLEYPTLTEFDGKYACSRYEKRTIPLDIFGPKVLLNLQLLKKTQHNRSRREIERLFSCQKLRDGRNKRSMLDEEIVAFARKLMLQKTIEYIAGARAFASVFSRLNPKVVIDIAGASRFAKPYLDEGVCYLEIQHGIIHEYHPGYIYPEFAREVLEEFYKNRYLTLYGELYRDILVEQSIWEEGNLFITGNPRFSNFVPLDRARFNAELKNHSGKRILLFTSQPIKAAQEITKDILERVVGHLSDKYLIVVKLHPREMPNNSPYKVLVRDHGVRMVSESPDLQNLLYYSYLHIGVSSTVLQEAVYFNTPNVIIASEYKTRTLDILTETNAAVVVREPEELLRLIDELGSNPESLSNMRQAQNFVKGKLFGERINDPAENIANLIYQFCQKKERL